MDGPYTVEAPKLGGETSRASLLYLRSAGEVLLKACVHFTSHFPFDTPVRTSTADYVNVLSNHLQSRVVMDKADLFTSVFHAFQLVV